VRRLAPILAALALVSATSGVRADDCLLDNCEDQHPPPTRSRVDHAEPARFRRNGSGPRGASQPGAFDFYVLSLSWSPGFCATGGAEKGKSQCRDGADIGFIVHGLWPQYDHGYPSDCRGDTSLPRSALAETDGVYPDRGLARYEWRKHGICSGLDPEAYFGAAKAARDAVTIPSRFKDPHAAQSLSPGDVTKAFLDANPALRPEMLAAICQHGTLDEVRVCFNRDLKSFRACPEVVREGCRGETMAIPAVR
jgi:ribonuclease T2